MRFEIDNGEVLGSAEWRGPGQVQVEMPDAGARAWFEHYFSQDDAYLTGPADAAEMAFGPRNGSEESFQRAAYGLAAYAYKVRAKGDGRRSGNHPSGSS